MKVNSKNIYFGYFCTFCIILPVLLWDVPYSLCDHIKHYLKNPSKEDKYEMFNTLEEQNNARKEKATEIIKTLGDVFHRRNSNAKGHVRLSITIMTTSRDIDVNTKVVAKNPRFLTQVVARFMEIVVEYRKKVDVVLNICDVDFRVDGHYEVDELSQFLPVFTRFPSESNHGYMHTFARMYKNQKQKNDYIFCLNKTYNTYDTDYIMMVEDDALPRYHLLQSIDYLVDNLLPRQEEKPLYVKLYHPERLQRYLSLESERLIELVSTSFLGGTILYVTLNSRFSSRQGFTIWMHCILYVTYCCLAIGRPNIQYLKYKITGLSSLYPDPYCCTQGVLFAVEHVPKTLSYLSQVFCYKKLPKDGALNAMASVVGGRSVLLQPNLFYHIGFSSALNRETTDPFVFRDLIYV